MELALSWVTQIGNTEQLETIPEYGPLHTYYTHYTIFDMSIYFY